MKRAALFTAILAALGARPRRTRLGCGRRGVGPPRGVEASGRVKK